MTDDIPAADDEAIVACTRCGRRIVPAGDGWRHIDPQGDLIKGCRAASFENDAGWDDRLSRSWNATPPAGVSVTDIPMVLTQRDRLRASIVAMAVRNEMERIHGGGNELDYSNEGGEDEGLTDKQMRRINEIVRNGVATALYALEHIAADPRCRLYVDFQARLIPEYWEEPELLESLTELTGKTTADLSSILHFGDR
jgi:hypothetical protein